MTDNNDGNQEPTPKPGQPDGAQKAGQSDGTQKAGQGDGPQKAGSASSQEDIDIAHGRGMSKGVLKGKSELAEELGFSTVSALRAAVNKGKATEPEPKKKESPPSKPGTDDDPADPLAKERQEITDLKGDITELLAQLMPVLGEAASIVGEDARSKAFSTLRVKNADDMDAYMHRYPAEEGETVEEHARRVIELYPKLAYKDGEEPKPKTPRRGPNPPDLNSEAGEDPKEEELTKIFGKVAKLRGNSSTIMTLLDKVQSKLNG